MNVWLLLIERRITGVIERVLGPFAGLRIEEMRIEDALTGGVVLQRRVGPRSPMWTDGATYFDHIVVQAGTFESPWGDRGR